MLDLRRAIAACVALTALSLPVGCYKKKEEVKIDLDAAVKAAEGRTPKDVKVPWDGISLNKPQAIKRFGRFIRNNLWDRLDKISRAAIMQGDKELVAMGQFYLAYMKARDLSSGEVSEDEVFTMVEKAVSLGYRNPHEISNSKPLLPLKALPKFNDMIAELEKEFNEGLRNKAKKAVDEEIAACKATPPDAWKPELKTVDGKDFWQDGPMLVVVSRIHHDGFDKLLPLLHETKKKAGDKMPVGVVFYQYEDGDAARQAQTTQYITQLNVEVPCAVVGRDKFQSLINVLDKRHDSVNEARKKKNNPFNPFQPIGLFMNGDRQTIYLSRGVIVQWEWEYIVEQFQKAMG